MVAGATGSVPAVIGCQLNGGRMVVQWSDGALVGCQLFGAWEANLTNPVVDRNTFRDCDCGVRLWRDADPLWALGVDNKFENVKMCCETTAVTDRAGLDHGQVWPNDNLDDLDQVDDDVHHYEDDEDGLEED